MKKEMIEKSTLIWIKEKGIVNEKGDPIEFKNHFFLIDIYNDDRQEIVAMKGSQVGVSTLGILIEGHDMKYLGINQIHTLPTDSNVWEFVPTKVDKIFKMNGLELEKNSTGIKGIGKGFIYYKGTFTESAPIMISSDRNVYDEVDKSKIKIIRDYSSRQSASKIGKKIYLSTPTIPDFGIHKLFLESDQKHWRFKCPKCGKEQHMDWKRNVDLDREIYICQKCHNELTHDTIRGGRWEARYPGRRMSGYWIPQMIATYRSCSDLIKEMRDADDLQYFYNFILGLPWLNPDAQISAGMIMKNLIPGENDKKDCVIGVDVQMRELYVMVGNEKGIFGIAVLEDSPDKTKWERLAELIDVYDARFTVIDATYDTNSVMAFAKKYPYKVYMNWYQEDPKRVDIMRFGDDIPFTGKRKPFEEEIKVLTDRNRIIDLIMEDLKKGKPKFNFRSGDERLLEFITHVKRLYVRKVTDKVGIERREWASLGQDDFMHAFIYWKIALTKKLRYGS